MISPDGSVTGGCSYVGTRGEAGYRAAGSCAGAGGPGGGPRPDLPPGTDLLPEIKHIVVLMMENHSYDNYLGMLAGRGDGLPVDAAGAPTAENVLPDGRRIGARHLPSTV